MRLLPTRLCATGLGRRPSFVPRGEATLLGCSGCWSRERMWVHRWAQLGLPLWALGTLQVTAGHAERGCGHASCRVLLATPA